MADRKALGARVDELAQRLNNLERSISQQRARNAPSEPAGEHRPYCGVPELPEPTFGPDVSAERASLIRVMSKKWVNGTVLHFYFFDNQTLGTTEAEKEVVRQAFREWKDLGLGLEFKEVSSRQESEIRIGFLRGDGAWSYVGRDILNQGQNERTMNFGWDLTRNAGEIDTALHEIGHTLGFPHEHQNPFAGIVWDEEAMYDELAGYPNYWSREKTYWNILRKIPPDTVEGTDWDPDSIMHYSFGAGLIKQPDEYKNGLYPDPGLSERDISQARLFYPTLKEVYPELKVFEAQQLSIGPGEQKNYTINPTATGKYNFRTFGDSDTVMVLFEERDGELRYVKGDDDSGTDLNASFRVRLYRGTRYVLRIRLYYSFSTGDSAVMMW